MRGISNVVTGIIGIVVTLMIGVIIIANLQGVVSNLNLTSTAQTTVTNLFNQTWSAFGLFVIVPIILVAVVLLRLLSGWGRGR